MEAAPTLRRSGTMEATAVEGLAFINGQLTPRRQQVFGSQLSDSPRVRRCNTMEETAREGAEFLGTPLPLGKRKRGNDDEDHPKKKKKPSPKKPSPKKKKSSPKKNKSSPKKTNKAAQLPTPEVVAPPPVSSHQSPKAKAKKKKKTPKPVLTSEVMLPIATPTTAQLPSVWQFTSSATCDAFGLCVAKGQVWFSNQDKHVYCLSLDGAPVKSFKLDSSAKCVLADGRFVYAGCDDGSLYDCSATRPRLMYRMETPAEAASNNILWMDMDDAALAVSDSRGRVSVLNFEGEEQWSTRMHPLAPPLENTSGRDTSGDGWMVRMDDKQVYYGGAQGGVTALQRAKGTTKTQSREWQLKLSSPVYFGDQCADYVLAGMQSGCCVRINKAGKQCGKFRIDGSVFACALSADGDVGFAGGNLHEGGVVVAHRFSTKETLFRVQLSGEPLSMQFAENRLFCALRGGALVCVDFSDTILESLASVVSLPKCTRSFTAEELFAAAAVEEKLADLPSTSSDGGKGVIVECTPDEDGTLRVRVVSKGYNSDWNVMFPRNMRVSGGRFVVEEIIAEDGFYRLDGQIAKLDE